VWTSWKRTDHAAPGDQRGEAICSVGLRKRRDQSHYRSFEATSNAYASVVLNYVMNSDYNYLNSCPKCQHCCIRTCGLTPIIIRYLWILHIKANIPANNGIYNYPNWVTAVNHTCLPLESAEQLRVLVNTWNNLWKFKINNKGGGGQVLSDALLVQLDQTTAAPNSPSDCRVRKLASFCMRPLLQPLPSLFSKAFPPPTDSIM
jgi:hypothetical protein